MKVRVIKDVPMRYSKGAELDMWPALAQRLVDLGVAEVINPAEATPEKPSAKKKKAAKKKG